MQKHNLSFLVVLLLVAVLPSGASGQGPTEGVVLKEVLSELPTRYQGVGFTKLQAGHVLINPTRRRHHSRGASVDTLRFARRGKKLPAHLPLNPSLAPSDCYVVEDLAKCGAGPKDVVVLFGNGRPHGDGWLIDVYVLESIHVGGRRQTGGARYLAHFSRTGGAWSLTDLTLSAVP